MVRSPQLPSWRPGPTRDAIVDFLSRADDVEPERRVAVFDNDGTLWCEKPRYVQLDFLIHELSATVETRPELAAVAEYAAVLSDDRASIAAIGLERIALALVDLFTGLDPDTFDARVRHFLATADHPALGVPYRQTVYQPMLELLDALRARDFGTYIVTGGGTEFVRAISRGLYGVEPEGVVGTLVTYEVVRTDGRLRLVRTNRVHGEVNEGEAKAANLQLALGRRPIFAAGNSSGDAAMLEFATAADGPTMAMLIDHDDAEREYAYAGEAATFEAEEPITATAERLGWTVVSMARDWERVFPGVPSDR